jgi:hypothetical protein
LIPDFYLLIPHFYLLPENALIEVEDFLIHKYQPAIDKNNAPIVRTSTAKQQKYPLTYGTGSYTRKKGTAMHKKPAAIVIPVAYPNERYKLFLFPLFIIEK